MTAPDALARLLDRVDLPTPPAALEARSLAAARTAMARPVARPDLWTRLWDSRAARLGWAAAMAGLVIGHVVLSLPSRRATVRNAQPMLLAGVVADPELAETVELPRLRSDRLPRLDPTRSAGPARPAEPTAPRRDDHDA